MFVYILASKTRRLYVGLTNDLVRRVWEHRMEVVPGFTRKYGIKQLVYYEQMKSPETAIRREKQVKDYARAKRRPSTISSTNAPATFTPCSIASRKTRKKRAI